MQNQFQNTYIHYLGSNTQPKKNHEKLTISGRANFYGQPDCKISVFLQLLLPLSWIPIKRFVEEGGHATFCVEGSLNRTLGVEQL